MNRRAVPTIHPNDLRDHASEDRIDRIWERIEHDITLPEPAPAKGMGFAFALVAATVTAFAGGFFAGRIIDDDNRSFATIRPLTPENSAPREVLAAGTEERTLALPVGGRITLSPRSTVEIGQPDRNRLTITLVQGAAAVDMTGAGTDSDVAIVADDARLSSRAGSILSVQRNSADLGVRVTSGLVSITSPAGSRQVTGGEPQVTVPLRAIAPVTMNHPVRPRAPVVRSPQPPEAHPVEPPAAVAAAAPDWRARCSAFDFAGALELLRQQPGGIAGAIESAGSASELMCINDAARTGGEQASAIAALSRVVEKFPADGNAPMAAYTLGKIYLGAKNNELAQKYLALAQSLSPDGALASDALCKQIAAEMKKGRKEEASRLAREYVAKYPDGSCKEDVDRILEGEEPPPDEQESEAPVEPSDAAAP